MVRAQAAKLLLEVFLNALPAADQVLREFGGDGNPIPQAVFPLDSKRTYFVIDFLLHQNSSYLLLFYPEPAGSCGNRR